MIVSNLCEYAPALAGDRGAGTRHPNLMPMDFACENQTIILASLAASPAARDLFRRLAIPPTIFDNPDILLVARSLLNSAADAPGGWRLRGDVLDSLGKDDDGRLLKDALDLRSGLLIDPATGNVDDDLACLRLRRGACTLARLWMPEKLRHAADQLERGEHYTVAVGGYLRSWVMLGDESGVGQ